MKKSLILFALIGTNFPIIFNSQKSNNKVVPACIYDIAYEKKNEIEYDEIFINKFEKNNEISIDSSFSPCISPNGKSIIYSKISMNQNTLSNYLEIMNLASMQKTKIKLNSYNPRSYTWSYDNDFIAYKVGSKLEGGYKIGVFKSDNRYFRVLDFVFEDELSTPTWTADSKSIIIADFKYVYKIGARQYKIDTLFAIDSLQDICILNNYKDRIWLTSDSNSLVFSAMLINEYYEGFMPSLCSAIFLYNLKTNELIRLTPVGMNALQPYLGLENEIYFVNWQQKEQTSIYKVNIIDKEITKILDNGRNISCRMQNDSIK